MVEIKEKGEFRYIDEGEGDVMVLLHGLFGALSNWEGVIRNFSSEHRVIIPMLPIYSMPLKKSGMDGLTDFVEKFVEMMGLDNMILIGNSLGGHVGLIYTLRNEEKVNRLVLTGSSGLFENSMGGSFPKRGSYEYIRERVEYTFYYPETATKELV
ncbi:MAG: alpha/beta fold hydrolase, partial [Cyclobacteriaceae bacterium]